MSYIDLLTEFHSLAEALDAVFGRALSQAGPNDLAPLVNEAQSLLDQLRRQPPLILAELFAIDERLQDIRPPWDRLDISGPVCVGLFNRRNACEAALGRAKELIPRQEVNLLRLQARLAEEQRRAEELISGQEGDLLSPHARRRVKPRCGQVTRWLTGLMHVP